MKFEPNTLRIILEELKQPYLSQSAMSRKLNVSRKAINFVMVNIWNKQADLTDYTHSICIKCKNLKSMDYFDKDKVGRFNDMCQVCEKEILTEVENLFMQGLGSRKIAENIGVNRSVIKVVLGKLGLKRHCGSVANISDTKLCRGTCGQVKDILEFSESGTRADGSIKRNSWCKSCFNKKQNEKRQSQSTYETPYTDEFLSKVKNLFDQGLGKRKIAKELDVHRGKITRAYNKLGLTNSDLTKNKQNPRTTHLITEKYCKDCNLILPVDCFNFYMDQMGRKKIKYVCKIHESERNRKKYIERKQKDVFYRFRHYVTSIIRGKLKKFLKTGFDESISGFVNFNLKEFVKHMELLFEPWMNWENWGKYNKKTWRDDDLSTWVWNVDHIIPQSDLPFDNLQHPNFIKCWSLENLRPYSAKQNCIDGARRIRHLK